MAIPGRLTLGSVCLLVFTALASAQFGGGPAWNTTGGDAQRTSWVRADPNISVANMQKPGFQFLWKVKLNNDARQNYSLSQAVEFPRYIGYRGFRSYAFFGGASNTTAAIDSDLGRVEWTHHFDVVPGQGATAGTATCPGAMTAGVSRPTPLTDNPLGTVAPGRGATIAKSAVGPAHQGAVQVAQALAAGGASGRGPRPPAAFGSNDLFALSTDGMLHLEYVSNGEEAQAPIRFLPPNANASGLIFNETDVYVSTSNNCGGVPNGVWGIWCVGNRPAQRREEGLQLEDERWQRSGHRVRNRRHCLRLDRRWRVFPGQLLRFDRFPRPEDTADEGFLHAGEIGVHYFSGCLRVQR